jgi:hypothetical protein
MLALVLLLAAQAQMPLPGEGIERSMRLLATSTAAKPNEVRVLVYGQSISKQAWSQQVERYLRETYPHAKLTFENRAIGGYSTQYLIRTMEADILPFRPDLILFHDYGSEELYERIIQWIRTHTSADILLQSDHITKPQTGDDPQDKHSFEWMPALARKYGLGLADIRGGWRAHLATTGQPPKELLRDNVHLNAAGEDLYAGITKRYLVVTPGFEGAYHYTDHYTDHNTDHADLKWRNHRATLSFTGNRVDLLTPTAVPLQVRIDGQAPAMIPNLHYHSRPTNTWDADWPTLIRVGQQAPLQTEEWTLKVTRKRNEAGTEFDYKLYGSITGPDGEGNSLKAFQSNSGRVTIDPKDFDVVRSQGLHKINMPNDWQVRWSTLPRFQDPVVPHSASRTLVYGLPNGTHTLTLIAPPGGKPPPVALRVYRPAMR